MNGTPRGPDDAWCASALRVELPVREWQAEAVRVEVAKAVFLKEPGYDG